MNDWQVGACDYLRRGREVLVGVAGGACVIRACSSLKEMVRSGSADHHVPSGRWESRHVGSLRRSHPLQGSSPRHQAHRHSRVVPVPPEVQGRADPVGPEALQAVWPSVGRSHPSGAPNR